MPQTVAFTGPREVALLDLEAQPVEPGTVRVRTWYSGVSAGTELTAYRGTNPYLAGTWDPSARMFVPGGASFTYPLEGWGYSEVGEVVEVADGVSDWSAGQVVYGIWGHRSEAVVPVARLRGTLAPADALTGCFARVGAVALNAVLAAPVVLGDRVAVFGQGVIGLIATRLAVLGGAEVAAVDAVPERLDRALGLGAASTVDARIEGGAGAAVRRWAGNGVDSAIELSGAVTALHQAVRSVAVDGTVVASGFYQGGAESLRLGEEFHHNRVRIVASQISGTPLALGARWDPTRLVVTVMGLIAVGRLDVLPLVTDLVDAGDAAAIFERLDRGDPTILQAVLRFPAAPLDGTGGTDGAGP